MRIKRVIPAAACGSALFSLVALPTPAGADEDGKVRIEAQADCAVQVDFHGFPQGDFYAEVTFEGIPPTGGGELLSDTVHIGEDGPGGMADLDASVTYDLSGPLADVEPFLDLGHHVKLTVEADGEYDSHMHHELFWVPDCEPPDEPDEPDEPDQPDQPDEPDVADEGRSTPPAPAVSGQPTLTG